MLYWQIWAVYCFMQSFALRGLFIKVFNILFMNQIVKSFCYVTCISIYSGNCNYFVKFSENIYYLKGFICIVKHVSEHMFSVFSLQMELESDYSLSAALIYSQAKRAWLNNLYCRIKVKY